MRHPSKVPQIWDQIGQELVEVDVEGAIEPQRGCDGRDDLADQPVEVGVTWPLDVTCRSRRTSVPSEAR